MAVKTIYEVFDILSFEGLDFSITATDKHDMTVDIISSTDAKTFMKKKYATRKYPVIMGQSATLADAVGSFYEDFDLFIRLHQHGIDKQYQALYNYEYSPIENVDRYENETASGTNSGSNSNTRTLNTTEGITYGKTETNSGSDTTTYGHTITASGNDTVTDSGTDRTTNSGNDNLTKDGTITTETQRAGFNAPNSYTPDTKNIETYDDYSEATAYGKIEAVAYGKTETTAHGRTDTESGSDSLTHGHVVTTGGSDSKTDTGTITDSGTESGSNSNNRELRVHGNIGVTTNNQLIEAELEMRKISLAEMILTDFINEYTYYV